MSFITAPIAAIGSAVLGGFGALSQGNANAQSAEYNAAVAKQNASIAIEQGRVAAEAQSRDAQRKIGSMIANYGASGVSGTSGSPLDVLADSAAMATLDNLTIKYNYALKASGFDNQAGLEALKSGTSKTSGILNAGAYALKGYGAYKDMGGSLGGIDIPGIFGSGSGAAATTESAAWLGGSEDLAMLLAL